MTGGKGRSRFTKNNILEGSKKVFRFGQNFYLEVKIEKTIVSEDFSTKTRKTVFFSIIVSPWEFFFWRVSAEIFLKQWVFGNPRINYVKPPWKGGGWWSSLCLKIYITCITQIGKQYETEITLYLVR